MDKTNANEIKVYQDELDAVYDDLWRAKSAVWKSSLVSLLLGIAFGWLMFSEPHADVIETPTVEQMIQSLPNIALASYLTLPRDDKRDMLVYLNINNEIPSEAAKAIAQDWCTINKKTQRVCRNARMASPIRGVK